jgi:glycosyltransferase involved in cell wall biosynthesis
MDRGQGSGLKGQRSSSPIVASPPARLVFLLQDLTFGGTQRQTLELAHRLNPARFQVEIWTLAAGHDFAPLARYYGLPVINLGRSQQVGSLALARLGRRLLHQRPDVLLPLTVVPNIWGRLLGRLARVSLIIGNCRGGGAPRRQHERYLWPLAHHILCNSQALKSVLTKSYGVPATRLTTIANGVDTEYFRPQPDPATGPPHLLYIGRLVPDKDPDTLLQAFQLTLPAHPDAKLWLVGDGPRRAALQDLASRLSISARVRFLSPTPDLRPLLHQATLLVLSSRTEALPNVILEAMAAGLPVVATKVGGVPELVDPGVTGWLVPPGHPPALAAALKQALADPAARQTMGRNARQRAVEDFSLDALIRRYEAVLDRLLMQARC